ncbi:glycosyltransferase [Streptomyces sp. SID3343]|uniref:glycosyltransferase family 2 protein n=1 Tax=Streptomyces sp. SID3343 TaxID=2690260 RepID=UPI001370065F|nr:glycosyltransferase [Streptomyces sp. SID3343]MYW03803.1 glycosyltransferase [Streptomyces sp. SID3343]
MSDAGESRGPVAVTVVIATRDRRDELCATLARLTSLPERPAVVVVDNASGDGSADAVRERYPRVRVIRSPTNLGAAGRNLGVEAAQTPYVAFSDDDSWWAPGALAEGAAVLDAHPGTAVLAARILVGTHEEADPVTGLMAHSPLGRRAHTPGPAVLGFLACGSIVRRDAFRQVGGFARFLLIGGEEQLLAWDLAAAGWNLAYAPSVVAHHHPSPVRDSVARRARVARNDVLVRLIRLPLRRGLADWFALARIAHADPAAREAALAVLAAAPTVLRRRRRLPARVLRDIDLVESVRPPLPEQPREAVRVAIDRS